MSETTISRVGVEAKGSATMSLENLIALTEEIKAILDAGMPLERGLLSLSEETGPGLGPAMEALGQRLNQGQSLAEAVAAERSRFPELYVAMVEAGLRSSRLSSALEGLIDYTRTTLDLRRTIGLALVYPWIVLSLGYVLFLGFVVLATPRLASAFEALRIAEPWWIKAQVAIGQTVWYWGPVGGLLLVGFPIAWFITNRGSLLVARWTVWIPGAGSIIRDIRAANFSGLLSLLLKHQTPLDQAVELAARSTGNETWSRAATLISEAVRRGDSVRSVLEPNSAEITDPRSMKALKSVPPFLRWALAMGQARNDLPDALKHAADSYRDKAARRINLVRAVFPVFLTIVIGGLVGLMYGLTLFVPFSTLLNELGIAL